MIKLLSILVVSAFAAETTPDTSLCSYWLEALDDISRWERMRVEDVPRIAEEENQYAAIDFDIELRQRILAIQKRIAKEAE